MTTESTASESQGISSEAMRLFGSLTRHLQALAALAGLEGREAVGAYVRAGIALGAALLLAAFGYVFVLLFVAFAIAHFAHLDWVWIALIFAVLHLGGAFFSISYMKKKFATPVFRGIAEEIRRDVAALRPERPAPAGPLTPSAPLM